MIFRAALNCIKAAVNLYIFKFELIIHIDKIIFERSIVKGSIFINDL